MNKIFAVLLAVTLPTPIVYQGQLLYPYYCTKTWVCDYVTEDIYRSHCRKRPCETVR